MMVVRGDRYSIFSTNGERSSKHTIILRTRQTFWLDQIAIDIRWRHGVIMARAEIVYAMIEAAIRSGIDLSNATSEAEITTARLGRGPARAGRRPARRNRT